MIKPPRTSQHASRRGAPGLRRSLVGDASAHRSTRHASERLHLSNTDHFAVLCVCTGNICRSPAAERLLAARLGPSVSATSAGTFGLVGSAIAGPTARLLRKAGVPADGFAARRLTAGLLASADLVLAMTKAHRRDVVELAPAVVRRAFTLRELARLLEEIQPGELPDAPPGTRLESAVAVVATRRTPSAISDDIDDPFGRPAAAYERAFAEIDEATARIAAVIAPYGT